MLPVSNSNRDEGYFDRAKVIYFVCVAVYFDLEKFWCFMCTIQMVYVHVSYEDVMNIACVLAGDIASMMCRRACKWVVLRGPEWGYPVISDQVTFWPIPSSHG